MKILFVCTHNRCRSILSEAIFNHHSQGRIEAFSAGSQPAGMVHPLTIKYLKDRGYQTQGLSSQSWDEFEGVGIDVVITVCDSAAKEPCPLWINDGIQLHWGLADPSKIEGDNKAVEKAFNEVIDLIEIRAQRLLSKDWSQLPKDQWRASLAAISDDTTAF